MMQQSHYLLRRLKSTARPDRDVQVMFSVIPGKKAIFFIHGFSGDALKTWSSFPELLPHYDKFEEYDLYFYGYNGIRADMNSSAGILRGFLHRLFSNTSDFVNSSMPGAIRREADFTYEEFVIVGHSLGAVISRRAVLDAIKMKYQWVQKIGFVFYAPAHSGACIPKLIIETVSSIPFIKYFSKFVQIYSPLVDQLTADSRDLKLLLKDTLEACCDGKNCQLIAKRVIVAENENVVTNEPFAHDDPPIVITDTIHTTVCKPNYRRLEPLNLLEEII